MPGRIRKSLLEPIPTEIDMPDDLSFIRFKGAFTLCVQGCRQRCRVRMPPGDRRPEKLKNVIISKALEAITTARAVFHLTERRQRQATAGNHCDKLY
jgi:hypothetical protein